MSSEAITEKLDEPEGSGWRRLRERSPSQVREDRPSFARGVGLVGLFFVLVGGLELVLLATERVSHWTALFSGNLFVVGGLGLLLFHAARDTDQQVRRAYGLFGFMWLAFAAIVTAVPFRGVETNLFLPYGVIGLTLGLFFLMPFVRNETEPNWRNAGLYTLGGGGALFALTGFIGGNVKEAFLMPYGIVLIVFGLFYLWAYLGLEGTTTDRGYKAAYGIGIVGFVVMVAAAGRSVLPQLFFTWGILKERPESFLVPSGMVLMTGGFVYLALSAALCSESIFVVLARRELAAFFYSPIAYIVMLSFMTVGWWTYSEFALTIWNLSRLGEVLREPVVQIFILNWIPIIFMVILGVPILTMRLLSEENRTGTMEVLLTAPVGETTIVLSKFCAVFLFYLILWLPWWLFLVAFRGETGQPFEYRPVITFFIAVACTGAGFLSMGVFFSSLSRNQIVAAVLTAVGMIFLTGTYFALSTARETTSSQGGGMPALVTILEHVSYLHLYVLSMRDGVLAPKQLIFPLSMAVFWLFLTVKVLESRKWR